MVSIAILASIAVQDLKLKKELAELTKQNNLAQAKIKELEAEPKPANPAGASPFDKPNNDPLADKYPSANPANVPSTNIKFNELVHDFGSINEGDIVSTTFKFKNTGKYVLLIYHAQAFCGCTVPEWPRDPIKPGESAEIKVQFNSHGKTGQVTKTVNISSNAVTPVISLTIRATVIPKAK